MKITRFPNNPVLGRNANNSWENHAAFNGCPVFDGAQYHLFYRAIGVQTDHEGETLDLSTIGLVDGTDPYTFNGTRRQVIAPSESFDRFGCEDPRVTKMDDTYYIFYTALSDYPHSPDGIKVAVATTKDFDTYEKHLVTPFNAKACVLFPQKVNGKYAALLSVDTDRPPVRIALALFDSIEDMWSEKFWHDWYADIDTHTLHFQRSLSDHIEVGAPPVLTDDGWVFFYSYIRNYGAEDPTIFGIEAALLDRDNPLTVLGRSYLPLLEPEEFYERHGTVENITFPSGALMDDDLFYLYYGAADTSVAVGTIAHDALLTLLKAKNYCENILPELRLERFEGNPILEPRDDWAWTAQYALNPTAFDDRGTIFILWRAQDHDDTSYIGLAQSTDGVRVDTIHDQPIYVPRISEEVRLDPGFSGCEDARATVLGNRLYIVYTAYNGYGPARIALSSITLDDFHENNWDAWTVPKIISPYDTDDKNGCLVDEKINDHYVFFHRIDRKIWVDYVADLAFEKPLAGHVIMEPREDTWDSLKVGIAGPPIKVPGSDDEWILIYHALSQHDGQYRLGAALLNLRDREHTLSARLDHPILEPRAQYENKGLRPGTVFSCGQVLREDTLFVYYGGADQVVCVGQMQFSCLVDELRAKRDA